MSNYVGSEAAKRLEGMILWGSNWAADMFMLQFGAAIQKTSHKGNVYFVGEFALHLQCAWRFTFADRVLIGSTDFYNNSANDGDVGADFNEGNYPWNGETPPLPSELIDFFKKNKSSLGIVEQVHVFHAGAFSLQLSSGYTFDVFPVLASNNEEHWRLLQWGGDHFVCGEPSGSEF